MNRFDPRARALATAAFALVSVFPIIVIGLNLDQRRDYSPTHQAISELALGAGGDLMIAAFCALGAGIFLIALSIRRSTEKARVTPALLFIASIPAGPLSAAFRTDRTGDAATLHGTIHNMAGLTAFLLILAAMVTGAFRFRREPAWRAHALPTGVLGALGVATFFLIPLLGDSHFGLAQRLFVGTFVVWLLSTAAHARRISSPAPRRLADEGFAVRT